MAKRPTKPKRDESSALTAATSSPSAPATRRHLRSERELRRKYMKFVVVFFVLAILIAVGVMYVTLSRTVIRITTIPQNVALETEVTLAPESDTSAWMVKGHHASVTLSESKTFAEISESAEVPDYATGVVKIVNTTSRTQPLVETTRLMSEGGVLFRTTKSISSAPGSTTEVPVKADQPGASGNIGPSKFTIVALHPSSQSAIFGQSDAAMTGGTRTAKALTQDDAVQFKDMVLESVTTSATAAAKDELAMKYADEVFLDDATMREIVSETISADVGAEVDSVEVSTTVKITGVSAHPQDMQTFLSGALGQQLTSDQRLLPDTINAIYSIKEVSSEPEQAVLRVRASGYADLSIEDPIFDRAKLTNLDQTSVEQYFKAFTEIQRVEVDFSPFWLFQTPTLPDHIELRLNQ